MVIRISQPSIVSPAMWAEPAELRMVGAARRLAVQLQQLQPNGGLIDSIDLPLGPVVSLSQASDT